VALDFASLSAVTSRGGIRLIPVETLRLFASENPTRESWSQLVALCLPTGGCEMGRRAVLTELGRDTQALRVEDRSALLFDLGLEAPQADLCVRTADAELISVLRSAAGKPVFDPESPAMGAILKANPHRVFISRVGRIEVFQPIPPANGKSPEGPHTHVLPRLLRHRRTHPATQQVPEGFAPCAHCYPAHPIRDAMGLPRPFDRAAHDSFQAMLRRLGDSEAIALKQRVAMAIAAGENPSAIPVTNKRFARANVRVALRQIAAGEAKSPTLAAWLAAHDSGRETATEEGADPSGHGE
jgi:hypothetical protein